MVFSWPSPSLAEVPELSYYNFMSLCSTVTVVVPSFFSNRLSTSRLIMQKLDFYEIPLTVKAQVVKSNQVREGLRCVKGRKRLMIL